METRDHASTPTPETTRPHATDGAEPRSARPRRMTRSREDRMLGGVCGGIARHFDVDPVIVRIATVALVCAVGTGAVAYVAAWILMPLDDRPAATPAVPSAPRPAHG
jgi:phage shock protein C